MNWEWKADGIFGDIRQTDADVDGWMVFRTFTEAKQALVRNFVNAADQYRWAAREARKLRKPQ